MPTSVALRTKSRLSSIKALSDVVLAAAVLVMVGMMIVPLPTGVLDALLALNIAVGTLMLLVALRIRDGLAFTAFPTILLITTLYRLALNVSSTRLILLQADAGEVIRSFGDFVVRGNYVVGAIVFLILTLIQFIVVAKGSERVAEVGARFTLDAMPGKQMSIDAELRSGAIDQEEAQRRRRNLQRESEFFGSMDGAMKFVKGDAIASIIITLVNIGGGLAVGIMMRDMDVGESLKVYGLLTIGDGLVSQIPALVISISAGLVVTRVSAENDASLAEQIGAQVFGRPVVLRTAAVFCVLLGIVPGLPLVPFVLIAALLFIVSQSLVARQRESVLVAASGEDAPAAVPALEPWGIELGSAYDMATVEQYCEELRAWSVRERGLPLPRPVLRNLSDLGAGGLRVLIREQVVIRTSLPSGHMLLFDAAPPATGTNLAHFVDPWTGRQGVWHPASAVAAAPEGQSLQPPMSREHVLQNLLRTALIAHSERFVTLQCVQDLVDGLRARSEAAVRHAIPKPLSVPLLTDVLRRLIDEGVSIRPLDEIIETLLTFVVTERDPLNLTELVRASQKRAISNALAEQGKLRCHLLSPEIEDMVRSGIKRTPAGAYLSVPAATAQDILSVIADGLSLRPGKRPPPVVTQPDVRRFVRKLIENQMPHVPVVSYQELAPEMVVEPISRLEI